MFKNGLGKFTQSGLKSFVYGIKDLHWVRLLVFFFEAIRYQSQERRQKVRWFPCIGDRTSTTPIDPYYFYQDVWGASIAMKLKPRRIVDIGSTALLVGFLSQIAPTESVDIRPLPVQLATLKSTCGSIVEFPFADSSVEYINSLCVIEHIGLGHYGDPMDALGSEKAICELRRVLAPDGYLVISVPVGPDCVVFNAHRVFSRDSLLAKFPDFEVVEEIFCIPSYSQVDPTPDLALGQSEVYCVCLRKCSLA